MLSRFAAVAVLAVCLSGCAGSLSVPNIIAANAAAGSAAGTPTNTADPLMNLANFTVNDLQAADADAVANGDDIAHACYPALTTFIQSLPTSKTGTTVLGAFSAFQKARDFRNVVAAGVPKYLLIACAPLVTEVRGDMLSLISGLPTIQ